MQLGIYGAGSVGKNLFDIALRVNARENRWEKIFFIDDSLHGEKDFYHSTVRSLQEVKQMHDYVETIVANGTPATRKKMANRLKDADLPLVNLIDPSAIVAETAKFTGGGQASFLIPQYPVMPLLAKIH